MTTTAKYPYFLVNTSIGGGGDRLGLVLSRHRTSEALAVAHRRGLTAFYVLDGATAPDVKEWILKEHEGVHFRAVGYDADDDAAADAILSAPGFGLV
jgi:hypothetical protein